MRFAAGLVAGWVLVGAALVMQASLWPGLDLAPLRLQLAAMVAGAGQFVSANLQWSVLPFSLVLAAYAVQYRRLRELLAGDEPAMDRVVRGEQHLDLCASLFFGIGVIWTAIGMRDALLHALGDGGMVAADGAFAVLQRLVDGGILLALSTTIVGGAGGYLMRAFKSVLLGDRIAALYLAESRRAERENLAVLQRIEERLARAGEGDGL